MDKLSGSEFATYFRDVHGYEPFPWQERITRQVLEGGRWPRVIDLPTGTGKTAVLDTAIFSLAVQPEVFPRRVVFVIDRRIVVDQVYERARRIQQKIKDGETTVLQKVRAALGSVGEDEPLGVAAIRGGIPIDNEWTHRPDLPWVVVSTVDQFGSRLLFRGYGVSRGMRPIHAGLAGNDCLVILDEVHLSRPFSETLAAIQSLPEGPLVRRFHVVEMSATPSNTNVTRFELLDSDLETSYELRRRVNAPKVAQIRTVPGKTKPPHDSVPPAVLRILRNELPDTVSCVGVIVNRVRTAREIHRLLSDKGYASHLITGRMRPIDRQSVIAAFEDAVDPDRQTGADDLTIVVATQAIEVGADFSFDALITECAPVDSLRQRFGRLDRRGRFAVDTGKPAMAWILGVPPSLKAKKPDPIYGGALLVTWEKLVRLAEKRSDKLIDVGLRSLQSFPEDAFAPRPNAPLLLRTYIEAWVQTNPEPVVQPSVEWFLHGIEEAREPDIALVWRWDDSEETLRLVPPRPAEFLHVPIGAARAWLATRTETEVADVDIPAQSRVDIPSDSENQRYTTWAGTGDGTQSVLLEDITPGTVMVVHPELGGIHGGSWDPSSTTAVEDLGDAAQLPHGKKATLRIDTRTLPNTSNLPSPSDEADTDYSRTERIEQWSREAGHLPPWAREFLSHTDGQFDIQTVHADSDETPYYILTERAVDPGSFDGSDRSASLTGAGITLRDHLEGVGDRAADLARRLRLTTDMEQDLRLAGRLHDLGKVDRRFQKGLVGGDEVDLAMLEDKPLAKSLPGRARRWFYPEGMRHEVASVSMAMSNPAVLQQAHDRDLVLHLIATHHGYSRPLPPIIKDPKPCTLRFDHDGHPMESTSDLVESSIALDMTERFWRLIERYGYYGLAWLETILRLADHRQSAEERIRVEGG